MSNDCGSRANIFLEVQSKSDNVLNDLKPLMIATKTGNRLVYSYGCNISGLMCMLACACMYACMWVWVWVCFSGSRTVSMERLSSTAGLKLTHHLLLHYWKVWHISAKSEINSMYIVCIIIIVVCPFSNGPAWFPCWSTVFRCWSEVWQLSCWPVSHPEKEHPPQVPERWAAVHSGHCCIRDGHR